MEKKTISIFRQKLISEVVTIIVPFFNRKRLLAQTILSILNQRYRKIQLILVDDGSTDGSFFVGRSFSDPRIQCLRLKKRQGKPAAINWALPLAQGEWVTIFDSDDVMTPNSLTVRTDFLKRHPETFAVMGRIGRVIDDLGKDLPTIHPICQHLYYALHVTRHMAKALGGLIPELFVYGDCPLSPLSATLLRRRALEETGPFDEGFAPWEDREYLTRTAIHQPIAFLDVPVLWYRVHSHNLSFRIVGGRVKEHPATDRLASQLKVRYAELLG